MKNLAVVLSTPIFTCMAAVVAAQAPPELPKPAKQHEWLTQLAGEWEFEGEVVPGPDQPGFKCNGKETVRAIGPFWIVAESENSIMGTPVAGVLTIGFDVKKDEFVGTWIDSMTNTMWTYDGALDDEGQTLTLRTEGPNPTNREKTAKFREVLEVKDKDHKVFTSSIQSDDGQWITFVTINYTRVE